MLKEFKEFAFKGNIVDMAVGFILGAGFTTVVKSLVSNIIMPPLGLLMGGVDFKSMKYVIQEAAVGQDGKEEAAEVAIAYGQFIDDAVAFCMLAFVVFLIVKKFIAGLAKKKEEAPKEPAKPSEEVVLLTEIRDALAKQ